MRPPAERGYAHAPRLVAEKYADIELAVAHVHGMLEELMHTAG